MTLTEFLTARHDQDEAAARKAADESAAEWQYASVHGSMQVQTVALLGSPGYEYHLPVAFDQEGLSDSVTEKAGLHIARWDPARVLAEVEAKRRIVEWHRPTSAPPGYLPNCEGCWEDSGMDGAPTYPCRTLRFLALPYADHPDYREEWKP